MGNLDNNLKLMVIQENIRMLKLLADHYTIRTRHMEVPKNTKTYVLLEENWDIFSRIPPKRYHIELTRFFGMYIGYCKDLDTLLYWEN